MGAEHVPEHDVLVDEVAIGGRPARQPLAARVLVGVLAGRVALVTPVRRHPHVVVEEAGPLAHL